MAEARSIQRTKMGSKTPIEVRSNNHGSYESDKTGNSFNQKTQDEKNIEVETVDETNDDFEVETVDESNDENDDEEELEPPRPHLDRAINHQVVCTVIATSELKGIISTDLPGRFPFTSDQLNNYIFIMYDFDSNNILGKPIKSREKSELVRGFEMCYKELKEANITPILHRLDNEISADLIAAITAKNMKYQTVTAYDHRQNLAERAIQTYKSFLISNLNGTDRDFPAYLWCRLLEQVELQVNLIRPSRINPNRSAWEELHGTFSFNATPLAPLGTKGVIYIQPEARDTTYSDHGKEGWYIGPVFKKYRCYRIYIPATNGTRDSNCVEFFPTKVDIPNATSNERLSAALEDLSYELRQIYDNENDLSFTDHGTPVNRAIKSLKLNINEQLEEALEILRDPNHQLSSKNDDKSQRVDEIDSPRVKKIPRKSKNMHQFKRCQ